MSLALSVGHDLSEDCKGDQVNAGQLKQPVNSCPEGLKSENFVDVVERRRPDHDKTE